MRSAVNFAVGGPGASDGVAPCKCESRDLLVAGEPNDMDTLRTRGLKPPRYVWRRLKPPRDFRKRGRSAGALALALSAPIMPTCRFGIGSVPLIGNKVARPWPRC